MWPGSVVIRSGGYQCAAWSLLRLSSTAMANGTRVYVTGVDRPHCRVDGRHSARHPHGDEEKASHLDDVGQL